MATKKEIKTYAKEHKCSIREAQRQLGETPTGNVSVMTDMEDFISNINADAVMRRVDYMDYNQDIDWNKVWGFGMYYNSNKDVGFEKSFGFFDDRDRVLKYGPIIQKGTKKLAKMMADDNDAKGFLEGIEFQIEQYWTLATGSPIQPERQYIQDLQEKYNFSDEVGKEVAGRSIALSCNIWYATCRGWIRNDNYNGLVFNLSNADIPTESVVDIRSNLSTL